MDSQDLARFMTVVTKENVNQYDDRVQNIL